MPLSCQAKNCYHTLCISNAILICHLDTRNMCMVLTLYKYFKHIEKPPRLMENRLTIDDIKVYSQGFGNKSGKPWGKYIQCLNPSTPG